MGRALRALALLAGMVACSGGPRHEASYVTQLPPEVRGSYEVFAHRCSKCHSLARPLDSGIDDDGYWAMYVDRMRRQPASGISVADRPQILAFLRYYALEQRKRKSPAASDAGDPPGPEEAK